jgi:hypothetical protein
MNASHHPNASLKPAMFPRRPFLRGAGITLFTLLAFIPGPTAIRAAEPGPALKALGATYGKSWAFKEPYLSLKTDAPLSEDAWKEIAALGTKAAYIGGKGIDDAAVARFAKMGMEGLAFDGTGITDAGLAAFKDAKLTKLSLGHALALKGSGAAALAGHPTLKELSIGGTGFGDVGMPHIASIKGLTRLQLNHDQITDAGLAALAHHPALESLMFSPQMTPRLTAASLATVATLKALKELTINDTVLTYEGGLKLLKTLPALQKLTLGKVGLSDADLAKLKADLPKVDIKFTPAEAGAVEKWQQQFQKTKPKGAALPPVNPPSVAPSTPPPAPDPATLIAPAPITLPPNVTANFAASIQPLLKDHCYKCHGADKQKGDVNLEEYRSAMAVADDPVIWNKVIDVIRSGEMPPSKEPKMADAAREKLSGAVEETLTASLLARGPEPGPPIIRRLTHSEYRRSVRDLLAVDFDVAGAVGMPEDPIGKGYDNLADALKIPPALTEKYLAAADEVLAKLFGDGAKRGTAPAPGASIAQMFRTATTPQASSQLARTLIGRFLPRAYRRPVTAEEVARYGTIFDRALAQRKTPTDAFRHMFKAVLLSPNFLFRIEEDRATAGSTKPYRVSDHELASRLSYFIWASIPDPDLNAVAVQGKLSNPAVLDAQVKRMLADPKAKALSEDFAAQWLQLRRLAEARPTTEFFPTFNDELKDAMRQEAMLFFDTLRTENRPITALLDADFTFVNGPLAEHYGIEGIKGAQMQRVALKPEQHRGGLLAMGGVLAMNSHTFRTSPTQRGKYVLEVVLGTPPPPPPNNVGQIEDAAKKGEVKTFRELLTQHATDANCQGCHQRIDPLGFGLDNYDAIGRWRSSTPDQPLDTAGVLPNGEKFDGPVELKKVLAGKRDRFVENVCEQMLTYALGRELKPYDKPVVKEIATALAKDGYKFSTLVSAVVKSFPFQHRKNAATPNQTASLSNP